MKEECSTSRKFIGGIVNQLQKQIEVEAKTVEDESQSLQENYGISSLERLN